MEKLKQDLMRLDPAYSALVAAAAARERELGKKQIDVLASALSTAMNDTVDKALKKVSSAAEVGLRGVAVRHLVLLRRLGRPLSLVLPLLRGLLVSRVWTSCRRRSWPWRILSLLIHAR